MTSELNFKHLRYFQVVAHEGHVTRAARRLNLSQSAVSTQIGLLEKRLGHALFHREKRSLRLTEAGRIALDHADALFGIGDDLVATLKRKGAKRLALRIGAIATLSRNFQMAFLRPVLGRVDVEIALRSASAAELYGGLADHHLDVVLTNHPPPFDATTLYVAHRLAEQPISLIGVPRLCAPRLSLPDRLSQVPLILPAAGTGLRMGFDALAARFEVRPQIAAEVDDIAMMRLLAREGVGLAVLPPIAVQDELAGRLLAIAAKLPALTETFYGVTVDRRFPNPLVRDLLRPRSYNFRPDRPAASSHPPNKLKRRK
ncbi:LysR family transcriptional regulator [Rhodoplanes serenus]|uniref:LysR family transcriptional regulator n=1 Tax=Rhodoplanes serenus TaxID=200615 RepID=A0A9X4XSM2_9BRAD|nr:LysR family transcriptional regulator [Rhodoplanes serenus]MTW19244.1 LysR family transcriptional regulator [Rhodoplanes serenus]